MTSAHVSVSTATAPADSLGASRRSPPAPDAPTRLETSDEESPSSLKFADEPPSQVISVYERLDKWKGCTLPGAPSLIVYKHNRARAAGMGFPSRLQVGKGLGLTDHETAAVFGWTTGDYRMVNPIARGMASVEFEDYPFLPQETTKAICRLSREDVMPYVRVLSSALSKLPALSTQERLWRGHRRELPTSVGSIFVLHGFTSVTRDRDCALEFAAKANEGTSKKRTLICLLEHFSARCLAKLSARKEEMEVIFPLDRTFEVVDLPDDTAEDDLMATRSATDRLRATMPDAEIDLVYVKEVGRPLGPDSSD